MRVFDILVYDSVLLIISSILLLDIYIIHTYRY